MPRPPAHPTSPLALVRVTGWLAVLAVAAALLAAGPAQGAVRPNTADYLEVDGIIDPAMSGFLDRQMSASTEGDTGAVLLRIDTPGALDTSVEPVLEDIRTSRVPVIVWAAPGDAQAGRAGALLLLAGHHSVMSPDATVGPLEPLDLKRFGLPADPDAADQLEGFDPAALEVIQDGPLTAEQALQAGLVDAIAPNVQELLRSLQGRQVRTPAGDVTLSEEPIVLRFLEMGLMERLVHASVQPAYAYLLVVLGLFGLLFELYNPGVGGAALFGGIFLAFGLYALTILPTSWLAVAGVFVAFGLLKADLSTMGFGFYSWGGLALLLASGAWMYPDAHPVLAMPLWAPAAAVVLTAMFFVQAMTSAIGARTAKPIAGAEGIVDAVGVARTDIAPDGQVMARGTLWRARTLGMAIAEGTPVKVLGVSGLTLMVEPTDETPAEQDRSDVGDAEAPEVNDPHGAGSKE